jgi:hypothetical protein
MHYPRRYIPSALPSVSARRTLSWMKQEAALFIIIVAQKEPVLEGVMIEILSLFSLCDL